MFTFLLPEEPGTRPGEKGSKYDSRGRENDEPREHRDTRSARKSSGVNLSAAQMSITAAFGLVLAGIVAKRDWFQKFTTWARK